MKIAKWDVWQSYRKDRGTPPWIKVHRNLLSNQDWVSLTDQEKGQLVSMWVLAADKGGEIPDDPEFIRKMCMLDDAPNINKFMGLGFIESVQRQDDATETPPRRQADAPETKAETKTDINPLSSGDDGEGRKSIPYQEIVNLYNETLTALPRALKVTPDRKRVIRARWNEDEERQDLAWWAKYFTFIRDGTYLQTASWSVGFDWVIGPKNMTKIIEGNYQGGNQ